MSQDRFETSGRPVFECNLLVDLVSFKVKVKVIMLGLMLAQRLWLYQTQISFKGNNISLTLESSALTNIELTIYKHSTGARQCKTTES